LAKPADDKNSLRRGLAELPILAVIALLVAFVLKTFVAQAYYIPSSSMEPQLHIGDRVIVSKLSYDLHDPHRGDIIVFPSPEDHSTDDSPLPLRFARGILEGVGLAKPEKEILIKRVIGLPGEVVEVEPLPGHPDRRHLLCVVTESAERIAPLLKALADPVRLRLLSLVASHEDGEACVCDLNDAFDLSQPTISHHLKVLHEVGLLDRSKRGVWVYYRVRPDALSDLAKLLGGVGA